MLSYPPFDLSRKRIVLTGASSGIGVALAREAARRGAALLLCGRDPERLEHCAELCRDAGAAGTECFAQDLTTTAGREALRAEITDPDLCVWNAGLALGGPFEESADDRLLAMLRLNLEAPVHLTRLFSEELIARQGALVLVSSGVGRQPLPYNVGYNTTKVGLTSFGRALALEWRHRQLGARVLVSHPGATETPMLEGVDAEKRTPKSVAVGTWDALEAGRSLWWAAGDDEELLAQYAAEEARADGRADFLRKFFGSFR